VEGIVSLGFFVAVVGDEFFYVEVAPAGEGLAVLVDF
jgi:hypothetical protein